MRKRWPILAIVVGWSLAAVVLGWSGYWVGHTHRYDDCAIVSYRSSVAYLCPINSARPPAPRPLPEGAEA
jgi:hypothetical protein